MSASRRIIVATGCALLVAAVILITSVLPAEYGWDPLGTGETLGLLGLAESDRSPLNSMEQDWQEDKIEFQLESFESVEYKYHLADGAAMFYEWHASGEVIFDMHSEPDGAAPGYAESFLQSRGTNDRGNYTAPFSGIHGWYWQNRGDQAVTVKLNTIGFYSFAIEFRDGREYRNEFREPQTGL